MVILLFYLSLNLFEDLKIFAVDVDSIQFEHIIKRRKLLFITEYARALLAAKSASPAPDEPQEAEDAAKLGNCFNDAKIQVI